MVFTLLLQKRVCRFPHSITDISSHFKKELDVCMNNNSIFSYTYQGKITKATNLGLKTIAS